MMGGELCLRTYLDYFGTDVSLCITLRMLVPMYVVQHSRRVLLYFHVHYVLKVAGSARQNKKPLVRRFGLTWFS